MRGFSDTKSTIERAYELARSGECANAGDVRRRLRQEGFANVDGEFTGAFTRSEIKRLCRQARAAPGVAEVG